MILPRDAELLGANSDELEIKGSVAHALIRLNVNVRRDLVASLANASGDASRDRVYVVLENVRGTHDATVLNVYIDVPNDTSLGDCRHLLAGSVALYGLRRASVQRGENRGLGLTFSLDVTRFFIEQPTAVSLDANEIRLSIVPNRQLPDPAAVIIGRVSIFRQKPGVDTAPN